MSVLENTPRATQVAIIHRVLREPHPKLALGSIASTYSMTLLELQTILARHGYPDPGRMHAAIANLTTTTAPTAVAADQADQVGEPALGHLTAVPVDKLHPDPENPRQHLEDIQELADSMLEVGLLQPIVARRHQGSLYVIAGHRRLAAAKLLRWTEVACIVHAEWTPDHVLAAMLIENGHRNDLDPIDEARGLTRLKIQLDCSDNELAKRVGRNQVYVSNRLALLALSADDQEAVRNGTMKLGEATHKGRSNAGKVRPKGQDKGWFLNHTHELATRAKARCLRMEHPRGRTVGGIACGECWESVIRADEHENMAAVSVKVGRCVTCGVTYPPVAP